MTDHVDNWHKLARFDTNIQGELHANLLRNNGITVSLQPLSAIPGMNSGIVLWVEDTVLAEAQRILDTIPTDGAALLDEMSDADFDALSANQSNATQGNATQGNATQGNATQGNSIIDDNNGGTL